MSAPKNHRIPVRRLVSGFVSLAIAGAAVATVATPAGAAANPVGADFNGDGYADLVIGAPGESADLQAGAGRIHVLYGSAAGLDVPSSTWFSQATSLVQGEPEVDDHFGDVVETGDFDGDGYDDLAIGTPLEDIGSVADAGAVQILYGTSQGLRVDGNQLFSMDTPGIADVPKAKGNFGGALAAGDFDGDGDDDLLVGAPGGNGHLVFLEGTAPGLSAASAKNMTISGGNGSRNLGASMAAGDIDGDGREDIAVGAPNDVVNGKAGAGRVVVFRGEPEFDFLGSTWGFYDQQSLFGNAEPLAHFGSAVEIGRLGADGRADLVISAPTFTGNDEGMVAVVPGKTGAAPNAAAAYQLRLDTMGIPGVTGVTSGEFGTSLAIGDLNGDGKGDLSVGAPGHDDGSTIGDGIVVFIPGNAGGLAKLSGKVARQSSPGIPGDPANLDEWGSSLLVTDPNGDGKPSLAVGAQFDEVSGVEHAGSVTLLPPAAPWPSKKNVRVINEDSPDFPDDAELGDLFGHSLG